MKQRKGGYKKECSSTIDLTSDNAIKQNSLSNELQTEVSNDCLSNEAVGNNHVKETDPMLQLSPDVAENTSVISADIGKNFKDDIFPNCLKRNTLESEKMKEVNMEQVENKFQPPETTFQQELLDMSIASGNFPFSPTILTNHNSKLKSTEVNKAIDTNIKDKKQKFKKKKCVRELTLGKQPLSELMRPKTLDDYVGQVALGTQKLLKVLFCNDQIPSLIVWGPPGCGKVSNSIIIVFCECYHLIKEV